MEFLPTISLTKAFPQHRYVKTCIKCAAGNDLCKFGQICATGNAFARLIMPIKNAYFPIVAGASEEGPIDPDESSMY